MSRKAFVHLLLATSAGIAISNPATAQTANADTVASDGGLGASADGQSGEGAIVVTGSRLQASGFQAPTPVTVLGAEQLEQRAPSTIAEVVNELPAFRQSVTNTQSQRANGQGGQNGVDLRGLGTNRTLVLVNGRRHVPTSNSGTIDVNMIPTPLVQRIDVVTGGASAAYGSDAVSGVVNFILDDKFVGLKGTVQYGISERGDNKEPTVSLAGESPFPMGAGIWSWVRTTATPKASERSIRAPGVASSPA